MYEFGLKCERTHLPFMQQKTAMKETNADVAAAAEAYLVPAEEDTDETKAVSQ
jgi:hypothetical protein